MGTEVMQAEKEESAKEDEKSGEQPVRSKSHSKLVFSIIPFVLLLLVIADTVYFYAQIKSLRSGSDQRSVELSNKLNTTTQQLGRLQQQQQAQDERLQNVVTALDKLSVNFSDLYQRNNSDAGWTLAEVKYLLIVASHRIVLEKDVATALVALQTADQRLQQMPDPGLLSVREQVIAAINNLKAAEQIDTAGLSLFLSDLARRVEDLPLNELIVAETDASAQINEQQHQGWKKLADSVWQELKSLVVVSKGHKEAVATMLPEQRYFLYQNLRLQLESARLSVLLKDENTFKESVQLVIDWLGQYFDPNDNDVSVALEWLENMLQVDFDYALPSIADSMAALDEYIDAQTEASLTTEDKFEESTEAVE